MDSKAEDDLDQLRGPFQLRTSSVSIGAQFPEAEVRAALPAGYEPVPEVTGGFYLYDARSGWAIAPFSSAFCWIDVKGHDSTAGETARCFIGAWYSGRAGTHISSYNVRVAVGESRQETLSDGSILAVGGPIGRPAFRIAVRPLGHPVSEAGARNYVAEHPRGHRVMATIAYDSFARPSEPLSAEILEMPEPPLRLVRPTRLLWGRYAPDNVMTIGPSQRVDGDGLGERIDEQLRLLSGLGRAALVVRAAGEFVACNELATTLLGHGLRRRGGRVAAEQPVDDAALLHLIAAAAVARIDWPSLDPVAVRRSDGRMPLLVQAVPFGAGIEAVPAELVTLLVTDPNRGGERQPVRGLALLGLSPAEARIASLVGAGLPPKEVARRLGNTEGTVRFTINQIYRKVGVSKQTELAQIVARLEGMEA